MRCHHWTPIHALLPGAWASLALLQSCAQVVTDAPDGGASDGPQVVDVQPEPGPVPPEAGFRVVFSSPMDVALLLVEPGRSDTVALVAEEHADLVSAAMNHGKLTAAQRALLVAAAARVPNDARSIELTPESPLHGGAWYLLISSRLKDADGRRLPGNGARFAFTVADRAPRGPLPRLDAPLPGSAAPRNLKRVRVAFPDGPPMGTISLVRPDGGVAAGPAAADGGALALDVRSLDPGEHRLAVDGQDVPGTSFLVAACERSAPPALVAPLDVRAGDTWAEVPVELDWPALVTIESTGASAQLMVRCAPDPCAADAGPPEPRCSGIARLQGLQPGSRYWLRVSIEDDEHNRAAAVDVPVDTVSVLPRAVISEVMASPPPPVPRSDGEYLEILNTGSSTLDLGRLAIAGPDDRVRPLAGAPAQGPTRLAPGERALAVGLDFDAARYALPAALPMVRADTRRLLGRGLADEPPPIRLLVLQPGDAGAVEIDRFPGGLKACVPGKSYERTLHGEIASFDCGVDGGTPGRAPSG